MVDNVLFIMLMSSLWIKCRVSDFAELSKMT